METIAKFFIDNSKFTVVLSLFVIVFGVGGLLRLNAESFPTVNFAMVKVTTIYDGASAQDIETKITKVIEDEIRTVSGLKDVRSVSQSGRSEIMIRVDIDNVEVDSVISDLQKAVDRVTDLPGDLKERPRFLEIKSEEFPVVELAILGDNMNRHRDLVADHLKEDLEDIKSVLSVRLDGFKKREFNIILLREKLDQYHIGIDEIINKVTLRNVNIPGGTLKKDDHQELLRVEGRIKNKSELENILIRSNFSGPQIYLSDLGTIEDGEEEPILLTRYNGKEATLLTVLKKGGADTIEMVEEIDKILNEYREKYNEQFEFTVFNSESSRVKNRLEVLGSNALSGLVLVLVFLMIFLPGKIGFMASLSLPIAVMASLGFMPPLGMNLNAITILALVIALGMMVDNSVVISENFTRLRGSEGMNPLQAALHSVRQLALPISATAFTTIAAFMPMLVTKGIMGQFIKYIPIVVSISLIISLLESFFLLPMRLVKTSKSTDKFKSSESDWFEQKLVLPFKKVVKWSVEYRYVTLGIFTVLIAMSIILMAVFNKMILFPADQTEIYIGRIETKVGTQLISTDKFMKEVDEKVHGALGEWIAHSVSRTGTISVGPADPKSKSGNNVAFLMIYVTEYAKNNISNSVILEKLRKLEFTSGSNVTFEAMVNGPPVGEPINGTFRSNNQENLDAVVKKVAEEMSKVNGVRDLTIVDVIGDDEIYVDIDYRKADRLSLDVKNIGDTIRAAISGKMVSNVNINNKKIDLKVQLHPNYRKDLDDLGNLLLRNQLGDLIPLGQVAKFRKESGTPQIKRFDFKRSKTLVGEIDEKVITAIKANKILLEIFKNIRSEYKDVSLVFGGEGENTKESMESLWNALGLSLIGIFALLVFVFNSFLRPGVIMTTIPLGLIGFSIAFYLHGRPISFLALIGMIGLGGIIVNSGIVLISFIDEMRRETNKSLTDVLVDASALRLRAVVVSSLTTISGLLPTAYGIGGTDAILVPMTLAMAWGLTSGTILTLVWVPAAYAILEDFTAGVSKLFGRLG